MKSVKKEWEKQRKKMKEDAIKEVKGASAFMKDTVKEVFFSKRKKGKK